MVEVVNVYAHTRNEKKKDLPVLEGEYVLNLKGVEVSEVVKGRAATPSGDTTRAVTDEARLMYAKFELCISMLSTIIAWSILWRGRLTQHFSDGHKLSTLHFFPPPHCTFHEH